MRHFMNGPMRRVVVVAIMATSLSASAYVLLNPREPLTFPKGLDFSCGMLEESGPEYRLSVPCKNDSLFRLHTTNPKGDCSCLKLFCPGTIQPRSTAFFTLIISPRKRCGKNVFRASFDVPETGAIYLITARADVKRAIAVRPQELDFSTSGTQRLWVTDDGVGATTVTRVQASDPVWDWRVSKAGAKPCEPMELALSLKPGAIARSTSESLRLSVRGEEGPEKELTIVASGLPTTHFIPSVPSIFVNLFPEERATYRITLRDRVSSRNVLPRGARVVLDAPFSTCRPICSVDGENVVVAVENGDTRAATVSGTVEIFASSEKIQIPLRVSCLSVRETQTGLLSSRSIVCDGDLAAAVHPHGYAQFPQANELGKRQDTYKVGPLSETVRETMQQVDRKFDSFMGTLDLVRNLEIETENPWSALQLTKCLGQDATIRSAGAPIGAVKSLSRADEFTSVFKGLSFPLNYTDGIATVAIPPYGIQQIAAEDHPGQFLFCLAQSGCGPDLVMNAERGISFHLADLVRGQMALFNQYSDNTFSIPALFHYLDDDAAFYDANGRLVEVSKLPTILLENPCGGYVDDTLYYYALAYIYSGIRHQPRYADVGARYAPVMTRLLAQARESQYDDGSVLTLLEAHRGMSQDEYLRFRGVQRIELNGLMFYWISQVADDKEIHEEWIYRLASATDLDIRQHIQKVIEKQVPPKTGDLAHAYAALRLYVSRLGNEQER